MNREFDVSAFDSIYPANERIYTGIKQLILSGEIPPDTVLTESGIAKLFSTSRTPAREALKKMESENILENIPRKGMLVKNIRGEDVREHYELSLLTEPYAAKLAARNHTSSQLGLLQDILDNIDSKNPHSGTTNYRFHCAVAEASGNKVLKECISQNRYILNLLGSSQNIAPTASQEEFSHKNIFDAIAKRDEELSYNLMYHHLQTAIDAFLSKTENT